MPDIFTSKDRQEKEEEKKIKRIQKLLAEENPPPETEKKDKSGKDKPKTVLLGEDELKEELKVKSKDTVFAKIQKEIDEIIKDKPKNGFLATFLGRPDKIRFETQDREEKVLALLRQHWIVNMGWIFGSIGLLALMPFLHYFPLLAFLPSGYTLVLTLAYFLFIFYFITENLLKWFYNVYIITDERLVDVDFVSLLYKRISNTKIDKIQDVSYDMSGIFEAFFNYGNVLIQTASEVPNIDFENLPKPQEIVSLLNQLIMEEELEKIEGRVK